jgi:hypothetical protein
LGAAKIRGVVKMVEREGSVERGVLGFVWVVLALVRVSVSVVCGLVVCALGVRGLMELAWQVENLWLD